MVDLERRSHALKAAIDPAWAAQQRFNAELLEARGLLEANAISAGQYAAREAQLRASLDATTAAQRRNSAATGVQRASYQSLGFQIQDITQTLALGINPLVVLAQQGGQTASAIAGMGGRFGRVAEFIAGPWGSMILGGVTVVGLLASGMFESGNKAEEAAEKKRKLGIAADGLGDATLRAAAAIDVLNRAQLQDRSAALAGDVISLANARLAQANATFTAARADAALRQAQGQARLADLEDGMVRSGRGARQLSTRSTRAGSELDRERQKAQIDVDTAQRELAALEAAYTKAQSTIRTQAYRTDSVLREGRLSLAVAATTAAQAQAKATIVRRQARIELDTGAISQNEYVRRIRAADAAEAAAERTSRSRAASTRAATKAAREAAAATREQAVAVEKAADSAARLAGIMDRFTADLAAKREERLLDQARQAKRQIDDLVGEAVGGKLFTKQDAYLQKDRIETGTAAEIRRPIDEVIQAQQQELALSRLLLAGREDEAELLRHKFGLLQNVREFSEKDLATLRQNIAAQRQINEAIEERQRNVAAIMGSVDDVRGAFESLLVDLPSKGPKAAGDFLKSIQSSFTRLSARMLTNKLFAGVDNKVNAWINGTDSVETATSSLLKSMSGTKGGMQELAEAAVAYARQVNDAAGSFGATESTISAADIASGTATARNAAAVLANGGSVAAKALGGGIAGFLGNIVARIGGSGAAAGAAGDEIVVNGRRPAGGLSFGTGEMPTSASVFNKIVGTLGDNLDKTFGTTFFKRMGGSFGTALQGAGEGAIASGFAKALGVKQSQTGAQIGGAIGSLIPQLGPFGGIIGGLVGGTLGGMLKKTKKGSSTLDVNANGELVIGSTAGNSGSREKAAKGLAGSVIASINDIARALGGDLTDSIGVSIGIRGKKYVVDTTGMRAPI